MYSPFYRSVLAVSVMVILFAGSWRSDASDWTCNAGQNNGWLPAQADPKQTLLLAMQQVQTDSSRRLEIHHFVQVFPDASLGQGGFAAQVISGAYTTVVMISDRAWIFRNGVPEYAIDLTHVPTEAMLQRDLSGGCIASAVNKARYHLLPWPR